MLPIFSIQLGIISWIDIYCRCTAVIILNVTHVCFCSKLKIEKMTSHGLRIVQRSAALLSRNSSLRNSVRNDGIFTKYRELPNGFLFNRKPLKPGEKREWESWQPIWYTGWTVATLVLIIGSYFRPDEGILEWGRREALTRIAEIDAAEASTFFEE